MFEAVSRTSIRLLLHVQSSQKDPLEPVGGNPVLVLRLGVALRVGAAGGAALGGAQVVHEGQPVLPTEVDKFDVAHARVEVHTWTEPRKA